MTSVLAKTPAALVSALLLATLSACGGGDGPDSDYCKDLKSAKPSIESLQSNGASQLYDVFKVTHTLADEAPSAVKDDWEVFVEAISEIEKALKDAGIDADELEDLQAGKQPEDINQEKLRGLPAKFQKLDAPAVVRAQKAIRKHANDVCKVTFES